LVAIFERGDEIALTIEHDNYRTHSSNYCKA